MVAIEEIVIPELRDPKDEMVLPTEIAGDAKAVISR